MREERNTPTPDIIHPPPKQPPQPRPRPKTNIPYPLNQPSLPQRHQIRSHERRDGHESAPAHARDGAAGDHAPFGAGEPAEEVPGGEEQVGEDEAGAAGEDVGEAAGEGLAGGVGDEVGGGEPGEEGEGGEGGGDGGGEGGDYGAVEGAEEDAYLKGELQH